MSKLTDLIDIVQKDINHTVNDDYWYYLLDDIAIEFIGDIFYTHDRVCRTIVESVLQVYNTGKVRQELSLKKLCELAVRLIVENPDEFKQDCIAIAKVRFGEDDEVRH